MIKKRVIRALIVAILIMLCVWRLWPHSLKDILPAKEMTFNTISVKVTEFSILNNSPNIDSYSLEIASPEDENYGAIMSILVSTRFRSDFRNLLPWDILSVDSGMKNITHSATIMLTWGDTNEEVCYLSFHGDRIVSVTISGNAEFLVYHPTNRSALKQIATYTIKNGVS